MNSGKSTRGGSRCIWRPADWVHVTRPCCAWFFRSFRRRHLRRTVFECSRALLGL